MVFPVLSSLCCRSVVVIDVHRDLHLSVGFEGNGEGGVAAKSGEFRVLGLEVG